jgi:polyphosphate kinase
MVFGDGAKAQAYLSSADWMPRNFERRVEVMFPIEAPELRRRICDEIIPIYLQDNTRARVLMPDGAYVRAAAWHDEQEHRAQQELLAGVAGAPTIKLSAAAPSTNGQDMDAADGAKSKHSKSR